MDFSVATRGGSLRAIPWGQIGVSLSHYNGEDGYCVKG